jgi:hypothetical protein
MTPRIPRLNAGDRSMFDGRLAAFREPVEIWVDSKLRKLTKNAGLRRLGRVLSGRGGHRRVLILLEPDPVSRLKAEVLDGGWKRFHHVLTYDPEILAAVPNAVLMPFGTSWVKPGDTAGPTRFAVSFLCGHKVQTDGHQLRHDLWHARARLTVPTDFWFSRHGGPPGESCANELGDSKLPLFASQFHLAIENCRIANYFTEKLVDCFVARVVPVYWGAPNIGEFFNPAGIIQADSLDTLIARCNELTPGTYASMRAAVEDNAKRALDYLDYAGPLNRKLESLGLHRA